MEKTAVDAHEGDREELAALRRDLDKLTAVVQTLADSLLSALDSDRRSYRFRVSRAPNGELRWWCPGQRIPDNHTDIRDATIDEARRMKRIVDLNAEDLLVGSNVRSPIDEDGAAVVAQATPVRSAGEEPQS